MDEQRSRSRSFLGSSFKAAESLIIAGNNKKIVNLEISGIRLIDKSQYKKQEVCQVCFVGFGKINRQHHCRICANAVCSGCSGSSINKQRCCDVCAYRYNFPDLETSKTQILFKLEEAAILYVQQRNALQQQLKRVNDQANDIEGVQKAIESSQKKIAQLQIQLEEIRAKKKDYESQIAQIEG